MCSNYLQSKGQFVDTTENEYCWKNGQGRADDSPTIESHIRIFSIHQVE